jgi:hypothetical protein
MSIAIQILSPLSLLIISIKPITSAYDISCISFVAFLLASSSALSDLSAPAPISTGKIAPVLPSSAALLLRCSSDFSSSFSGMPGPNSDFSMTLVLVFAFSFLVADRFPYQKRKKPSARRTSAPRVTPVPMAALVPLDNPLFADDTGDVDAALLLVDEDVVELEDWKLLNVVSELCELDREFEVDVGAKELEKIDEVLGRIDEVVEV